MRLFEILVLRGGDRTSIGDLLDEGVNKNEDEETAEGLRFVGVNGEERTSISRSEATRRARSGRSGATHG